MSKIAFLVATDFEDSEFRIPFDRLKAAGHEPVVVGLKAGETVEGKGKKEKVKVEKTAADVAPKDFAAVVIPGGYSPDHLRVDAGIVDFVRKFVATGKPVAAVCHGPQLLIEAGVVEGKTLTCFQSVRTDLKNAGANVVDQQVAKDPPFITSRTPDDLEAFSKAIVGELASNGARSGAEQARPS